MLTAIYAPNEIEPQQPPQGRNKLGANYFGDYLNNLPLQSNGIPSSNLPAYGMLPMPYVRFLVAMMQHDPTLRPSIAEGRIRSSQAKRDVLGQTGNTYS